MIRNSTEPISTMKKKIQVSLTPGQSETFSVTELFENQNRPFLRVGTNLGMF